MRAGIVGMNVVANQKKKRVVDHAQAVKEMQIRIALLSLAHDPRHAFTIKFRPLAVDVATGFQIGAGEPISLEVSR